MVDTNEINYWWGPRKTPDFNSSPHNILIYIY